MLLLNKRTPQSSLKWLLKPTPEADANRGDPRSFSVVAGVVPSSPERGRIQTDPDARLRAVRDAFRRAPQPFSGRPVGTAAEGAPAQFLLQLLPIPYVAGRQRGVGRIAGNPHHQRNQFFPQQSPAGSVSQGNHRGNPASQAGAA